MKNQIEINNVEELISYIENNELTSEQMNKLLTETLKVFMSLDDDRKTVLKKLKIYLAKYGHLIIRDRPLFLGL